MRQMKFSRHTAKSSLIKIQHVGRGTTVDSGLLSARANLYTCKLVQRLFASLIHASSSCLIRSGPARKHTRKREPRHTNCRLAGGHSLRLRATFIGVHDCAGRDRRDTSRAVSQFLSSRCHGNSTVRTHGGDGIS